MPEFRQNMLTNEWVIIASERAKRPEDFQTGEEARPPLPEISASCPFCPGHEAQTPPATLTVERSGKWAVRVVPNKFAALQSYGSFRPKRVGRFLRAPGYGISEVIIEAPQHNLTLATMDDESVETVVKAYKQRYKSAAQGDQICFVNIFQNHGVRAGTSLEHPHSQLIATPIIPPHVRNPIEQAVRYYDTHGQCVYCMMLDEEIRRNERLITESDYFIAYAPFASRTPFEVRIMPKKHQASFPDMGDRETADFAGILRNILARIHEGLNNPDYNFIIRSAPVGDENAKYFHWYLLIIPKLTTTAGFEIGTGIYINVTYPEQCAEFLKNIKVEAKASAKARAS
ncbi:MAG TPA: galactose-1-phosphate uridylyltransferase [Burkholderiales bacterium]|nr:galactose-1-phosphate uridylyltransferase [Burkholderiales bacterium]